MYKYSLLGPFSVAHMCACSVSASWDWLTDQGTSLKMLVVTCPWHSFLKVPLSTQQVAQPLPNTGVAFTVCL